MKIKGSKQFIASVNNIDIAFLCRMKYRYIMGKECRASMMRRFMEAGSDNFDIVREFQLLDKLRGVCTNYK